MTERDFDEGTTVVYVDSNANRYTGVIDYSYGEEEPGHIRVEKPDGAAVYVPVDAILSTHNINLS